HVTDPARDLPPHYRGRLPADAFALVEPGRARLVVGTAAPELADRKPWWWAVQQLNADGNPVGAGTDPAWGTRYRTAEQALAAGEKALAALERRLAAPRALPRPVHPPIGDLVL